MKTALLGGLAAVLFFVSLALWMLRPGTRLGEGRPAPGFELRDQAGKTHRLDDYAGCWLVLYFYPRDDTPGCTREACGFRDDIDTFDELDSALIGISVDDPDSHAAFAQKYALPFPLLADPGGKTAAAYGSLLNLGVVRFARRHTFIIAPDGGIAARFDQVQPATHAADVARTLRALRDARTAKPVGDAI